LRMVPCLLASVACATSIARSVNFCCRADNELYLALTGGSAKYFRFDSPTRAIEQVKPDSALLVFAEDYPASRCAVTAAFFEIARKKRLRLYIEYPAHVPGMELPAAASAAWERAVVVTPAFGQDLPELSLLSPHACQFIPVSVSHPLIVMARVAGY